MEKNKVYTLEGIYNLKEPVEFITEIDRIQTDFKLPIRYSGYCNPLENEPFYNISRLCYL